MSQQSYNPVPVYQQNSSLAVVSLVTGIVSFVFLPFLAAIAAVITGNLAKKEIEESGGQLTGEGLATAGLILGWINIALNAIGFLVGIFILLGILGLITLPLCLMPLASVFNN